MGPQPSACSSLWFIPLQLPERNTFLCSRRAWETSIRESGALRTASWARRTSAPVDTWPQHVYILPPQHGILRHCISGMHCILHYDHSATCVMASRSAEITQARPDQQKSRRRGSQISRRSRRMPPDQQRSRAGPPDQTVMDTGTHTYQSTEITQALQISRDHTQVVPPDQQRSRRLTSLRSSFTWPDQWLHAGRTVPYQTAVTRLLPHHILSVAFGSLTFKAKLFMSHLPEMWQWTAVAGMVSGSMPLREWQ